MTSVLALDGNNWVRVDGLDLLYLNGFGATQIILNWIEFEKDVSFFLSNRGISESLTPVLKDVPCSSVWHTQGRNRAALILDELGRQRVWHRYTHSLTHKLSPTITHPHCSYCRSSFIYISLTHTNARALVRTHTKNWQTWLDIW